MEVSPFTVNLTSIHATDKQNHHDKRTQHKKNTALEEPMMPNGQKFAGDYNCCFSYNNVVVFYASKSLDGFRVPPLQKLRLRHILTHSTGNL